MIISFKNILKLITYYIIDIFVQPSKIIKPKSLLLIRLDAIGDYILFRNFIEELKKDEKYKHYSITLLGNITWKSLSEELDSSFVDEFIWIDRNKFTKNIFYRYKILQKLVKNGYEVLLSPIYSRELFFADNIAKLITAKKKIASSGVCNNIKRFPKNTADQYYDILLPAEDKPMFEFNRNKEFFENFLQKKININRPTLQRINSQLKYQLPKKYAIIFIGASCDSKKWNIAKFTRAANYLNSKYDLDIVLCGSSDDYERANQFEHSYEGKLFNLVGKTSLLELSTVASHADLILSNDTMLPHLAVSLMTPNIFVIYNGSHYGRFVPYPKEICENHHVIYHPYIEKDLYNYKILSNNYGYESDLYIDEISFTIVKDKIDSVLTK